MTALAHLAARRRLSASVSRITVFTASVVMSCSTPSAKLEVPSAARPEPVRRDKRPADPNETASRDGSAHATTESGAYESRCTAGEMEACVEAGNQLHLRKLESRDYVPQVATQDHARAFELYVRACDGGSGRGCNMAGIMLQHGSGIPRDMPRAVSFLSRGCDLQNVVACYNLGFVLVLGEGVKQDVPRAVSPLEFACVNNDATACTSLALIYERGLLGSRAVQKAQEYYRRAVPILRKACDSDQTVCVEWASVALAAKVDTPAATRTLREHCAAGDPGSCLILGRAGDDPLDRFKKACEHGGRCFALAELYRRGKGGDRLRSEALTLYARACAEGEWEACAFAGPKNKALEGLGFTKTRCEALKDPTACAVLKRYEARIRQLEQSP